MPCPEQARKNLRQCLLLLPAVLLITSAGLADSDYQDWPVYYGDTRASKYAPLDQINADNAAGLEVAWIWETPDNAIFREYDHVSAGIWKSTPIMVDGVLYVSTALGYVAAIDAVTGETIWTFSTGSWRHERRPNWGNNHRGVSFWQHGAEARILMPTNDGVLWSLDAHSGARDPAFGDNGQIDLKQALGREASIGDYGVIFPPVIVNDVVIVGSSIHDIPMMSDQLAPGHVRGFDVRTGEQRWIFHTIPQDQEYGADTWENDSWRYAGAANVWTMMAADHEHGIVYLPTSTPSNDWYGGERLGDNLFAESLVALDAASGERIWHFQLVRHGLWDYDLPSPPNLVDITVAGRDIKALAQITKQGWILILDRLSGEPVWPIEERDVPQSDVPGERTAATQPHPTWPLPVEPQGISADTLIDFTPELREQALNIIAPYDYGHMYTPPSTRGTIQFPGYSGGPNWMGGAVDPETNIMYLPSFSLPRFLRLIAPEPDASDYRYIRDRGFTLSGPQGLPLIKPPYARITAVDLNTGEHLWMVPHGEGIRQQIIDLGIEDPGPVGSPDRTGPLLTSAVSQKFAYFQKATKQLRQGAARRAWWFHAQGLQRGCGGLVAFPSGELRSAPDCVALLANGTTIPCAARLVRGASEFAESMRTSDSRHLGIAAYRSA